MSKKGKGRNALPSKIIELRGGSAHTHRPERSDEPEPPANMPPCPPNITGLAKEEWDRAGKILNDIGLLTEVDMAVFAGYCLAYASWVDATIQVRERGAVYVEGGKKDKETGKLIGGIPKINPYVKLAKDSYEQMQKAAVQFGMTSSARVGLKVETPKSKSKAQEFRDKKKRG